MSGIVNDNMSLRSGVIKAASGVEKRDDNPIPFAAEVWISGGNQLTPRESGAGTGTQTAALSAAGTVAGTTYSTIAETYDGTSWSAIENVLTGVTENAGGAGIQAAALVIGGGTGTPTVNYTQEYDGTSWAQGGTLTSGAGTGGATYGCGIQTAALKMAGEMTPTPWNRCGEYDGTSWTTGGTTNTARRWNQGAGLQTAAVIFGGRGNGSPLYISVTEEYDGSSWTTVNGMIFGEQEGSGGGIQTAAYACAGKDAVNTTQSRQAQLYDGTSWAATGSLLMARRYAASGMQVQSGAMVSGGATVGPMTNTTEEYIGSSISLGVDEGTVWFNTTSQQLLVGAPGSGVWSMANPISQTLVKAASAGTRDAALKIGGMTGWDEGTQSGVTQEYDGTAWATGGSLQTARSSMTRAGTQTAAMCAGGSTYGGSSGSYSMNNTEEYDGTSWANSANLSNGVQDTEGDGIQTQAWIAGGYDHPTNNLTATQLFTGISWVAVSGVLNTGRQYCNGCGTINAGLIVGGRHDYSATTEEFDGTSWSYGANVLTALWKSGVFGTLTAAVSASGQRTSPSARIVNTQEYDGTTWSVGGDVILGRMTTGTGSQSQGMIVAGETTASGNTGVNSVEVYNKSISGVQLN